MSIRKSHQPSESIFMNRRTLLGGALAGMAIDPAPAIGEKTVDEARLKSGNPGAGFKPWTAAEPNTMVFDTVSECKPLRDDQLISLMGNTGGRGGGRGAA